MSEFELPDDEAVADKRRYVEAQRKMQRRLDAELDHLPPGDHQLVDGEWVRRTIVLTAPRGLADRIRDDAWHWGVAMSHLLLGCYLFAIGEGPLADCVARVRAESMARTHLREAGRRGVMVRKEKRRKNGK
jgi:hypothetical protein